MPQTFLSSITCHVLLPYVMNALRLMVLGILGLLLLEACSPYRHRMVRVRADHTVERAVFHLQPPNEEKPAPKGVELYAPLTQCAGVTMPPLPATQAAVVPPMSEPKAIPMAPKAIRGLSSCKVIRHNKDTATPDPQEELARLKVRAANIWAWMSLVTILFSFPFIFLPICSYLASRQALKIYSRYYVEDMQHYYMLAKVINIASIVLFGLSLLYLLGLVIFVLVILMI
jgi:hypothetical protein